MFERKGRPEKAPEAEKGHIITAEPRAQDFTVQHFMGLVEHRPHAGMLEVVDKKGDYHYRQVKNTPARIRYFKQFGFEVVNTPDDAKMEDAGSPDGRRIVGNLVLMRQPMEYNRMHRRALDMKAEQTRRGPVESYKGKAKRMGVEVVDKMRETRGPLDMELPSIDEDYREFER